MVTILVVNNAEPGINDFTDPILKILDKCKVKSDFIEYKNCRLTKLQNYDGIILSGSPMGNDIVDHHLTYFQWIKEYEKPVLGICAGHHLAGAIYGSELYRSVEPESGDNYVEILLDDALTLELPKQIRVKQMHNDSISLPKDFIQLATSSRCKNQLMRHKDKPLYSCQFHPEYYNHELFENFIWIAKNSKTNTY